MVLSKCSGCHLMYSCTGELEASLPGMAKLTKYGHFAHTVLDYNPC